VSFLSISNLQLGHRFDHTTGVSFLKAAALCAVYVMALLVMLPLLLFIEKPCRKYINTKWAGSSI